MVCPCAVALIPFAMAPAAKQAMETAAGRAAAVALLPLLCLVTGFWLSVISVEDVQNSISCVASCSCAQGWAFGGFAAYLLAIRAAFNSKRPRDTKATDTSLKANVAVPAEKLAAKAA